MTSEIGILNRIGVALAGDSAVTMTNLYDNSSVTLNSANKLFALGGNHKIGIMISGAASFMGTPWEVFINSYAEQLDSEPKENLHEYEQDFINYICKQDIYMPEYKQDYIRKMCNQFCNMVFNGAKNVSDDVYESIHVLEKKLKDMKLVLKVDSEELFNNYGEIVKEVFSSYLADLFQTYGKDSNYKDAYQLYLQVLPIYLAKGQYAEGTEIVLAGYGKQDLYPSLESIWIDGIVNNSIKYKLNQNITTDIRNKDSVSAAIIPFAQSDTINNITQGIYPTIRSAIDDQLSELYAKLVNQDEEDEEYIRNRIISVQNNINNLISNYSQPFVQMIDGLSVIELSEMAETLINLTSFQRKFSGSLRTVGGPTDVLVISRGKGVVWIKNKDSYRD